MDNRCSKYEGLFVFSDDETFRKHIAECEECRREYEKMEKVSDLISEVRFHYLSRAKRSKLKNFSAACALILLLFSTITAGVVMNNEDLMDTLRYGESLSAEDLGFPVDSYGLLMVD